MNNHANGNPPVQCLVNYVCPNTVTADDLAPFKSTNPDETKVQCHERKLNFLAVNDIK